MKTSIQTQPAADLMRTRGWSVHQHVDALRQVSLGGALEAGLPAPCGHIAQRVLHHHRVTDMTALPTTLTTEKVAAMTEANLIAEEMVERAFGAQWRKLIALHEVVASLRRTKWSHSTGIQRWAAL